MKKTEGMKIYEKPEVNHNQSDYSEIDNNGEVEEVASAPTELHHHELVNGIADEDSEVITVNSYSMFTPEQIRAQMVTTVLQDPITISTFADPQFQDLISMANRTFIVPNIEEVLEERFKKEQIELIHKLAENLIVYDICIFPLTICETKYAILELAYFDKNGQLITHLLDYFSLVKSATYQRKIWEKIKELKMDIIIGDIYIWDSEFNQIRIELCKALSIQQNDVDKSKADIGLDLKDLKTELNEIEQLFMEDQPECERIMWSLCNHYEIEFTRLGKLITKWRLFENEVKTKIGSDFNNKEEALAYCQHIKPKIPRNLFKFSRMDVYTEVVLEVVSCLEGSRKIPRKKQKLSLTIPSAKKEQLLRMLKECHKLVDSGMEMYEQFKALCDKIRNNESVQYPNSKPFLDAAARATASVNVKEHLWVIAAFLTIWDESRNNSVHV